MVADPHELHNLAELPEHQPTRRNLEAALDRWIAETADFPATRRRRADNTNRVTGVKFTQKIAPLTDVD